MAGSAAVSLVNAGLEGFVRAAALEAPRGIRVNVVSPPWVTETLEMDYDSLAYLDEHGVRPGSSATIASRAPDGTVVVAVGRDTVALGPSLAAEVYALVD